jgi:AcrR family transcriptional regulator
MLANCYAEVEINIMSPSCRKGPDRRSHMRIGLLAGDGSAVIFHSPPLRNAESVMPASYAGRTIIVCIFLIACDAMLSTANPTALKLLDACEYVLCEVEALEDVTVRRVAGEANANPSAISYHFGSQEKLIIAVAHRVYRRLNAERLVLLQKAVARRMPAPPDLEEVIAALIGPSVRWSLDPTSSYAVLTHFTHMAQRSRDPELYRAIVEGVEHHMAFVPYLRRIAPWLDDAAVGWRINCALGIRSQVIHSRLRTEVLTYHTIDLNDPDEAIRRMVEVIAPMFRRTACS